jgi:hypothetical protein
MLQQTLTHPSSTLRNPRLCSPQHQPAQASIVVESLAPQHTALCEESLSDSDTHNITAMSLAIVPPLILTVVVYDGKSPCEGEGNAHASRITQTP